MRKTIQSGFTLIELVVVIVILGILAAFAVPRFMGLENQARIAAVSAMRGTISSASSMVYGVALAQGVTGATGTVLINGQNIPVVFGYPANTAFSTTATFLPALVQDTSGFTVVAGPPVSFQKTGSATPATCAVRYTQPAGAGLQPTIVYGTGTTTPPAAAAC